MGYSGADGRLCSRVQKSHKLGLPLSSALTKDTVLLRHLILESKITADGYCSREIKRNLLLGRKAMTNSMDISLSKLRETVKDGETGMLPSMWSQSQTQLSNRATTNLSVSSSVR